MTGRRECGKVSDMDVRCVALEEDVYPQRLRQLHDAPQRLYYRGALPQGEPSVAIVGSRHPSAYGIMAAKQLAAALAKRGCRIVSGMAKGIDAAAHEGCLEAGGKTTAVLGCGPDICYPAANRYLYDRICACGCLLTEYPPGDPPLVWHFPARNRLISALSDRVVVIEAKGKSGSLITADFALEQGRDVYALPGRITDVMSEGCNGLIAQGAGILCSVEGFVREWDALEKRSPEDADQDICPKLHLEKEEALVYSCFDFYPKGIQQAQNECGLELLPLLSAVAGLCDKGLLRESFKNQYVRLK